MINLSDGWYIEYENGNVTNYMSKVEADIICNRYNNYHLLDEGSAYIKYDKDFNIGLIEDDLLSYGFFKGDFHIIIKQSDLYILFIIIGVPECDIADMSSIIEFLEEYEKEESEVAHDYKYKGSFSTIMEALEKLNKVCW